jgi:hypothetical protein
LALLSEIMKSLASKGCLRSSLLRKEVSVLSQEVAVSIEFLGNT